MFAFLAYPEAQITLSDPNLFFNDSKTIISPINPNVSLSDAVNRFLDEPLGLPFFSLSIVSSGFDVLIFSILVIGS